MPVTSIAFSPNGRQLATGSGDKAARVWDLSTGMLSALLEVCSMGRGLHPPPAHHPHLLQGYIAAVSPISGRGETRVPSTSQLTSRLRYWPQIGRRNGIMGLCVF